MKKKNKNKAKSGNKKFNENKTITASRVSFLHRAACLISEHGEAPNDAFAKLSRRYATQLKGLASSQVMQLGLPVSRSMCRVCREVFVASKLDKFELASDNNCINRRCGHCGSVRRYQKSETHQTMDIAEVRAALKSGTFGLKE